MILSLSRFIAVTDHPDQDIIVNVRAAITSRPDRRAVRRSACSLAREAGNAEAQHDGAIRQTRCTPTRSGTARCRGNTPASSKPGLKAEVAELMALAEAADRADVRTTQKSLATNEELAKVRGSSGNAVARVPRRKFIESSGARTSLSGIIAEYEAKLDSRIEKAEMMTATLKIRTARPSEPPYMAEALEALYGPAESRTHEKSRIKAG